LASFSFLPFCHSEYTNFLHGKPQNLLEFSIEYFCFMPKLNLSPWQIIIEFISVVFAVLLALGLNSYKQNRDLIKESQTLQRKILAECERNASELDSVMSKNQSYLNYLDSLQGISTELDGFTISFSSELLTKSAWVYTQTSPAFTELNESFLEDAARLYEMQNYFMQVSNEMFQNIGEMLLASEEIPPSTMLLTCSYFLDNIVKTGNELEELYSGFLDKYGIEQ